MDDREHGRTAGNAGRTGENCGRADRGGIWADGERTGADRGAFGRTGGGLEGGFAI